MTTESNPGEAHEPREAVLERLVEEQGGRLYSLGLRFCGNREEAEDLVQETFLQAYRNWSKFEGRSSAATWLYSIAARVCQRFHRRRVGEPEQHQSLEQLLPLGEASMAVVPSPAEGPLAEEIREEGRRQIEAAIAALPLAFRMPLVLKEIVGLSLLEIAQILGLKEATVKTRVHRARLRIRKALEAALPLASVPQAIYSKRICLDLLRAKQETLDRGLPFVFPGQIVCERCSELFRTLDLAQDVCREIARGELPETLRAELVQAIEAGSRGPTE